MCNYNMVETVRQSVESILLTTGSDFEIFVVDGGSDDGSIELLESLSEEYSRFRYEARDPDPDRHLGADRQYSIEHAEGEYVLFDLDCDDEYSEGIEDFVTIYHEIEKDRKKPFMLKGEAINMAPKSLMQRIPFRNVGMAEDKDLYRRALAEDAIIYVKHYPFWRNIGYDTAATKKSLLERWFRVQVTFFRTGITFPSYVTWLLWRCRKYTEYRLKRPVAEIGMLSLAYIVANRQPSFELPDEYKKMGKQYADRAELRKPLGELESELGFSIDRSNLSSRGQEIFYSDEISALEPENPEVRNHHIDDS